MSWVLAKLHQLNVEMEWDNSRNSSVVTANKVIKPLSALVYGTELRNEVGRETNQLPLCVCERLEEIVAS